MFWGHKKRRAQRKAPRIAMLSTIAWRTPPRHYGPREQLVYWLTESLIKRGFDVTLFATKDSHTNAHLHAIAPTPYEESSIHRPAWECLHTSEVFEHADDFDLIHNHFDFLPLTYTQLVTTPMVTTIHGFHHPDIAAVYRKYNNRTSYVSISNADRHADLTYIDTVYNGIDLTLFTCNPRPQDYLLFFGRISHDKGTREAIEIAKIAKKKIILAGITPEKEYFEREIKPFIDGHDVQYIGSIGPVERNQILGNAYALLHPINFDEPFGLSVVEAMACGTPVIAFNRGSMSELISNGKTGFLVNTVDEAVTAVKDIARINRSACTDHVARHFTLDQMVEGYIRVYEKVLGR